jgi:hypothetical protein
MKKLLLLVLFCSNIYFAFSNATVTQKGWRWRHDDGDEATASWIKGKNIALTTQPCQDTDTLRLRITFEVAPDPNWPSNTATKTVSPLLSYSTSSAGPFTVIPTAASSGEHFELALSDYITASSSSPINTTKQISTGPYSAGFIVDDSITSTANFTTPGGVTSAQEFEWVIVPTANAVAQKYYFKLENLDSYTTSNLPALTLSATVCTAIINPVISESSVTVYPNPVSKTEDVLISSSSVRIEKITLYDKLQKPLITLIDMQQLNTRDLEAGMYILEIVTDKGVAMKKLLVE